MLESQGLTELSNSSLIRDSSRQFGIWLFRGYDLAIFRDNFLDQIQSKIQHFPFQNEGRGNVLSIKMKRPGSCRYQAFSNFYLSTETDL